MILQSIEAILKNLHLCCPKNLLSIENGVQAKSILFFSYFFIFKGLLF